MKAFFSALAQPILIMLSAAAFAAAFMPIRDTMDLGSVRVMGLYVLGVLLIAPVVGEPMGILGGLVSILMKLAGALAFFVGVVALIPWLLALAVVLGKEGLLSANGISALLWLPVYCGLPAYIAFAASDLEISFK